VADFGLVARIADLDDALLAVGVKPTPVGAEVWIALSTFGERRASVGEVQQRWGGQLQGALGVAPQRTPPHGGLT
jgi:hypothetical protein